MDAETLKGQLINSYLNQQLTAIEGDSGYDVNEPHGGSSGSSARAVQPMELPDNAVLDEFKNQVRIWIEIDNQVAKLQQAMRERNAVKKQLTEKILRFMGKYNIEDLNTRDGSKLRYRVATVKPTVSKAEIKKRLLENYNKVQNLDQLTEIVFSAQEQVQKVSLRRMRAGSGGAQGGQT